ncbi:MAG: NAD(P)H-hydrate dehydratase [Candidatus Melainabacteria bacterium]|nr:MAG: NAD(P)H-hydrate dehydratase [Candidatus Melainabacteria bacterium]
MRSTRILTTSQIRRLEADWIEQCGSNWSQVLMEVAGRGAAKIALKMWENDPGNVIVICGRGNNGGDGMVIARYLHMWGLPVSVWLVSKDSSPKIEMSTVESKTNRTILENLGVDVTVSNESPLHALSEVTLIVDALFGTGLDRDLEGAFRTAVDAINRSGKSVLAVDMPSGVNSDTGKVMGSAVRADHTVTFGYLKPGLLCHPGANLAGDLSVIDIGLPDADEDEQPIITLITSDYVRGLLPPRPTDSNKGTFGSVLTIAGSLGMSGATLLASQSALRTGAGLSLLATPKTLVLNLPPGEVIYHAIPETTDYSIGTSAIKNVEKLVERVTAIILGPGLSTHDETVSFVHTFVKDCLAENDKPCIIDADALNAIAKDTSVIPASAEHIVLTPHPKELSRLMDCSVQEIQEDRVKAASDAAAKFGCVVVLKGAHSIVASPDGELFVNPTGNAGMATAGAGDVLSGIIGGLLAQGLKPTDAAAVGVYLHGAAGDYAAAEIGETGLIAGDIMSAIPFAISNIEKGDASELEQQLTGIIAAE